jgi:AraC-like DNA-binding protein
MSSDGHAIMVLSVTMPKGEWFDWHVHPDHQFAWAAEGMLTVQIGDATWVLPPSRALWIPAGTLHRTGAASTSSMHSVYFGGRHWGDPTVVAVGPLLAELIRYLADLTLPSGPRRRAEAVLRDLLVPVPVSTIHVPEVSARLALIARGLTDDPADDRDLAAWGRLIGASSRTLARAFVTETGMTFGAWRTQIRLLASLPLLGAGMPVATTARRVGYATPSAFVAAFRRVTGTTPGTYFT